MIDYSKWCAIRDGVERHLTPVQIADELRLDIKTVRAVCDDVIVLYAGRMVESMPASSIDASLHHPYALLLFASVPKLQRGWLEQTAMPAVVAATGAVPTPRSGRGCAFFDRCDARLPGLCDEQAPPFRE